MNYTFLPYLEETDLKRKYHIRAAIVLLFFLSISLIVGIGSLFPAYMHASLEEELHLRDIAALKQGGFVDALKATESDLSGSAAFMSDLAGSVVPDPFSGAIAGIAAVRGSVEIDSFSLSSVGSSTLSVSISGMAPTRAVLLAFKNRLGALTPGISVTLPVSELARDADIPFSIQIVE